MGEKIPSLRITVCHHSASLVLPNGDPRDVYIYVTRHAKRYELGGRRHFEKMRLKVNVASRKNSIPKRVSKRSLTYYKTGSKAFITPRFSANRLSNILYDIKCSLLNVRKLKLGRESSTQFSL